jgi:Fe-S-cluster containining protein
MPSAVVWLSLGGYAVIEMVTGGAVARFAWAQLSRLFAKGDLAAVALLRLVRPPRYVLVGDCQRCGVCCQQIEADLPRWMRDTWVMQLFVTFHERLHRFSLVGRTDDGRLVFACGHVGQDGRCGIYARRPLLCRDYPKRPFFHQPQVLPGCGFSIAPRVVARMRRRASLPIVNPGVTVHHPTRLHRGHDRAADFEWLDDTEAVSKILPS